MIYLILEHMDIPEKEWNKHNSLLLEIYEMLSKLVKASGEELLTPTEVCKMLKIGRSTYTRYVESGVFEQVRLKAGNNSRVYVKRSEINRLIEEGKI